MKKVIHHKFKKGDSLIVDPEKQDGIMKIECPDCHAHFIFEERSILEGVRKVLCPVCSCLIAEIGEVS